MRIGYIWMSKKSFMYYGRPSKCMEYDPLGPTELEYEFLYNIRDQTMLFLRMNPNHQGYAAEILTRVDEMVETLARRLEQPDD